MPIRIMLNESRPWQSVFTQCPLPLKVNVLPCLLFLTSAAPLYVLTPFLFFYAFHCAGFTGVSPSSLPTDNDPLMTAVNLLEENWISIQETFEVVSRVLSWLFVGLWPKKRATVQKDNLNKLAKSFDTTEDPTL
jgi:hypothetical protein